MILEPMIAARMIKKPISIVCCGFIPADFPIFTVTVSPAKKPTATQRPYV